MTSRVSCSFAFQIWSQYKLSLITLYKCNPQLISITDEHPNIRHFNTSLPALMYLTWRNFIPTDWSAALRKIMNENLNTAINTVLNLPIKATPMRICEEMYEQLHREITGKCAITNFMHCIINLWPVLALNDGENLIFLLHLIQLLFLLLSQPQKRKHRLPRRGFWSDKLRKHVVNIKKCSASLCKEIFCFS